jgi:hypothetical protein
VSEWQGATELCPFHGQVAHRRWDEEAVALESLQVRDGGPALDRPGERQADARPVHPSVGDDVRERSRPSWQVQTVSSLRRIPAVERSGAPRNAFRSPTTPIRYETSRPQ